MDEDQIARLERQLRRQQKALLGLQDTAAEATKTVELDQSSVGRLSRMDALQSQALAQDVRRRREQRLVAIAKALQRIDEDEYGYCLRCAHDMDPRRLEIDPTAEYCVACAEEGEG